MNSSILKITLPASLCACFIITSVNAATCPTDIKRDKESYWYSDQAPGWKSKKTTPENITVDAKDFGGVVYSPKHQRLACVYKTSDGKWFALVSEKSPHIVVDQSAKDDSGKGLAWRHSKQYGDYACGMPFTTKLSKCEFQLNEQKKRDHETHQEKTSSKSSSHHPHHAKKSITHSHPTKITKKVASKVGKSKANENKKVIKKADTNPQKAALQQLAPPRATMTQKQIATLLH